MGRLDWWNLRAEHTPYEWLMQLAMYAVAPFGERRADMRAARQTAGLIASQRAEAMDADEFCSLWSTLANYLECDVDKDEEEDVDMQALNDIKGAAG